MSLTGGKYGEIPGTTPGNRLRPEGTPCAGNPWFPRGPLLAGAWVMLACAEPAMVSFVRAFRQ